MFISMRKLAADLPLTGASSLHSAIDSIEQLGSEMISLCGQPPQGGAPAFNHAVFKRRGLGNPPSALHLMATPLPPADQDAEVDASGQNASHTVIGSAPVWVDGTLKLVTAWRQSGPGQ